MPEATPDIPQPALLPPGPRVITPLKRVSAYRTSDGRVHEKRSAAELREAEIAVDALAEQLAGPMGNSDFLIGLLHEHGAAIEQALAVLRKARAKAVVS